MPLQSTSCRLALVWQLLTLEPLGEDVWKKWLEEHNYDNVLKIETHPQVRDFKLEMECFDPTTRSCSMVKGQCLPMCASVVPGPTPFLLARPTVEEWKVKQNYGTNELKVILHGSSLREERKATISSTSWTMRTTMTTWRSSLRRSSTTMTSLPLSLSWNLKPKPRSVAIMCSTRRSFQDPRTNRSTNR